MTSPPLKKKLAPARSARCRVSGSGLILLLAGAMLWGCDAKQTTPAAPGPLPVTVAQAAARDLPDERRYPGVTQAINVVQIDARVQGYLEERLFTEGDRVTTGQKLYQLQRQPYAAQVLEAQAEVTIATSNLQFAQSEYDRNQPLSTTGAISQQKWDNLTRTLDDARGKLAAAEADLTQAQLNLSYCQIASPLNGRIGQTQIDAGNLVGPDTASGSALAQVVQLDPMQVTFEPSSDLFPAYQQAMDTGPVPVQITFAQDHGPALVFDGHLDLINNTAQTGSSTFLARAVFPSPRMRVIPGQYAAVRVRLRTLPGAVMIPTAALHEDPQTHYVWVVKTDHTLKRNNVTLGVTHGAQTHILTGLKAGDTVVVQADPKGLKTGTKITIKKPTPAPAPGSSPGSSPGSHPGSLSPHEGTDLSGISSGTSSGTEKTSGSKSTGVTAKSAENISGGESGGAGKTSGDNGAQTTSDRTGVTSRGAREASGGAGVTSGGAGETSGGTSGGGGGRD